jgi:lysophospholipase L1-like esterase
MDAERNHHHLVAGGEPSKFKRESAMLRSAPLMQPTECMAAHIAAASTSQRSLHEFPFAGDSLTASGNWGWTLAGNPLSAATLAEFGASINDVAVQVSSARAYHAAFLLVMAGTNDLLTYHHSLEQIVCDYRSLLDKAPTGPRLIVTLIPYTSLREHTDKIRAVNSEIRILSEHKGADIIDLNSQLSNDGILAKDLTTNGLHLNQRAYQIWGDQILKTYKISRPLRVVRRSCRRRDHSPGSSWYRLRQARHPWPCWA